FGAEPSALSIDQNSFELTLAPANKPGDAASAVVNGDKGYTHLTNNATTGKRDASTTIGIIRSLSGNELRVWGEFPAGGHSFSAFLSVYIVTLFAATVFKSLLMSSR